MPVDISQPVYPPYEGQPIDTAWGKAVSDGVIQRFSSISDRDTKWPSPPAGALSAVRNVLHGYVNSTWVPQTLFTDYIPFKNTGVGNGNPNMVQAFDTRFDLQPCPYPCIIQATMDCMLWGGATGSIESFIYSNDTAAPQSAGWISRVAIFNNLPPRQFLPQSVTMISTKMNPRTNQPGAHYNEGDVPTFFVRYHFWNGTLAFEGHFTAMYLPVSLQITTG